MRRLSVCLIALLVPLPAAHAATGVCRAAAWSIKASLRAFRPSARTHDPYARISIRNAVKRRRAAVLDYGALLTDKEMRKFPLSDNDRALFQQSEGRFFQVGGKKGLAMLDAIAGTAHCHTPFLFNLASGAPVAVTTPTPDNPYDLCSYGGVELGYARRTPFYAQSYDNFIDADRLQIYTLADGALVKTCTITAHYDIPYKTVEKNCPQPTLCAAFSARVEKWAQQYRESKSQILDPDLTPAPPGPEPADDPAAFPTLGGAQTSLAPEPFRFDGTDHWFALKGVDGADLLRIGAAYQGPVNMANWQSFTLLVLYKSGQPVASFVVERQRGAFRSLQVEMSQ